MIFIILILLSIYGTDAFKPSSLMKSSSSLSVTSPVTSSVANLEKLDWNADGYKTYKWNDKNIHYIELGDKTKPPILLIHGFGASYYHWRYNIPYLVSQGYHVFAMDMLGFGLSDKPVQDYDASVWQTQTLGKFDYN